jgi:competence protein ComEA
VQNWAANHGIPPITLVLLGVALLAGVVLTLVAGTATGGFGLARGSAPPIEVRAREVAPSPTAILYVHVDGAVQAPGVYSLPAGARVFEAIESAGGATDAAALRELNLAARVADGQKLIIPSRGTASQDPAEGAVASPPAANVARATPPTQASGSDARINLNTATQRMLESLPGIGPVTATRIIEYRQANGPFTRVEQLREARLVNAPTYERVRNLVSVE